MGEIRPKTCEGVGITWTAACKRLFSLGLLLTDGAVFQIFETVEDGEEDEDEDEDEDGEEEEVVLLDDWDDDEL